jgi:hypothetical protein
MVAGFSRLGTFLEKLFPLLLICGKNVSQISGHMAGSCSEFSLVLKDIELFYKLGHSP